MTHTNYVLAYKLMIKQVDINGYGEAFVVGDSLSSALDKQEFLQPR